MANTKVTKAVLADDSVGIFQLDITNDPSDGQALTAVANPNGYDLTWANNTVAGISSSADATAITIDSSERVGIGTASPSHPLHISSTGHTQYQQHRQASSVGTGQEMKFAFDTADGTEEVYGSIYTDIKANTNGAESGNIALRVADAGSLGYVIHGAGGGDTTLYADGAAVMTLKDGGNVGIGTTSPAQKLDVDGDIVADNIYAGGSAVQNGTQKKNYLNTTSYPNGSTDSFTLSASEAPIGSWVNLGIYISSGNSGGDQYLYLRQTNGYGSYLYGYVDSWYYTWAASNWWYIGTSGDRTFSITHGTIADSNSNDFRRVLYFGYKMDN